MNNLKDIYISLYNFPYFAQVKKKPIFLINVIHTFFKTWEN